MKKFSKLQWILIGVVAVALIAGIISLNIWSRAKKHDEASVAALSSDQYRQLYAHKNTKLKNGVAVLEIKDLTYFYNHNADVLTFEIVKDGENDGIFVALEPSTIYEIQEEELKQQALLLLTLVPDLEYVEYQSGGNLCGKWQQFGETGDHVFIAESDDVMKAYVKDGYEFQKFMDTLRPTYASQGIHETIGKQLADKAKKVHPEDVCVVEAHRIVSAVNENGKTVASTLTSIGSYQIVDGKPVRTEEMRIEPAVYTLVQNKDGYYEFEHVNFYVAGDDTEGAIRQMFLKEIANNVMNNIETFRADLEAQEQQAAEQWAATQK